MMRILRATVTALQEGQTVKAVLRQEFGFAESMLSHLKFVEHAVLKNGAPTRLMEKVRMGDGIEVQLESADAKNFPLPKLYEDEDLLIFSKPAGMAVHGIAGGPDTVESLWRTTVGTALHAVNRLDRGTSGAMVAAKNGFIHDRLRELLHTADFSRSYLAVVTGCVAAERGEIDLPLGRENGKSFPSPEGKTALTRYEVLARGNGCTLLRLHLLTGRTHQIRAHCAAIGHPLAGDRLYGAEDDFGRPALHSAEVSLKHPLSGEVLCVTAPVPEDMEELVRGKMMKIFEK